MKKQILRIDINVPKIDRFLLIQIYVLIMLKDIRFHVYVEKKLARIVRAQSTNRPYLISGKLT